MAEQSSAPLKIGGYLVERLSVGTHTLGKNVTIVFLMNNGGTGPGPSASCLSCMISKVSQCANLVCPDIKKNDPDASCSDAIRECMRLACQGSCKESLSGGGILVLA
jgi:hypothetical protein